MKKWIIFLVIGLVSLSVGRPGPVTASPIIGYGQSQTPRQAANTITQVVLVTPSGTYGNLKLGRWKLLDNFTSPDYEPTSGADAYWWQPGFNDSAWTDTVEVNWHDAWLTWPYIPELGKYVWGFRNVTWDHQSTWLHRNTFSITIPPGYQMTGAILQTFADDLQTVYINGIKLPITSSVPGGTALNLAYLNVGLNTLAMTDFSIGWLAGIQYRLTITFTQTDPPTVDVLVNGVDGPVTVSTGATYTVSWSSSANADSCTGSNELNGYTAKSGSFPTSKASPGTYTYTMTCSNSNGSRSDSAIVNVIGPPSVSVNAPAFATAPASYKATWTSAGAVSCTGSSRFNGLFGLSGSRSENNLPAGSYDYVVSCVNALGIRATDKKQTIVYAAPGVDVKVDGSDGPLTYFEPAGFTVTWTSTNASSCTALNDLPDPVGLNGSLAFSDVLQGVYRFTVQCSNPAGATAIDSVLVSVAPQIPVVDLQIDGGDGPITRVAPAGYTLSWTSQNATACTASSSDNAWNGSVSPAGSQALANVPAGNYTYTLTCTNLSGSASDSVSASVLAPLSGTLSAVYTRLLLNAPNLDQPAQTLTGTAAGGQGPYAISVHVRAPSGIQNSYARSGSAWSLPPAATGDLDFGTTEEGVWTAWAVITDSAGRTFQTASISWNVSWHPVHGRP